MSPRAANPRILHATMDPHGADPCPIPLSGVQRNPINMRVPHSGDLSDAHPKVLKTYKLKTPCVYDPL